MIRSFLAIEFPGTIRKKIEDVQRDLRSSNADVRWVNPGHIHLTLKFFGNIEESSIESIIQSIEEPVRTISPFPLRIRGIGSFPNLKNPRVIWMGLVELVDEKKILVSLQKELERELKRIGFQPEDRPFHPHLTLGRMRSSRGKDELVGRMEKLKEEEFGDFQIEKIILFKSDLKPTGPIYTPLREVKLGG